MYFCEYFQTDVLINFFIPLSRTEAITWENFVLEKAGSRLYKRGIPSYRDETFYM